jgi:hypothetical protein
MCSYPHSGRCYLALRLSPPAGPIAAHESCRSVGMLPASVTTQEEVATMSRAISLVQQPGAGGCWIGLKRNKGVF